MAKIMKLSPLTAIFGAVAGLAAGATNPCGPADEAAKMEALTRDARRETRDERRATSGRVREKPRLASHVSRHNGAGGRPPVAARPRLPPRPKTFAESLARGCARPRGGG